MTDIINKNATFTFRSKFEKLLDDENRTIFIGAFEKFCDMNPDYARKLLWHLTYETDPDAINVTLSKLDLSLEVISSDKISTLRNELRFQYEQLQPDFLKVDVPEECQDVFVALKNRTDAIVASIVYEHCQNRMYLDQDALNRILFLMSSDKENYQFGGIRELQFYTEETAYLLPFHAQIHDMFKALSDHYQNQCGTASKNLPFEGLARQLEDAGMELPFDVEPLQEVLSEVANEELQSMPVAEEPVSDSGFKPLTLEAILPHKDLFASFVKDSDLNILFQIGQLGFDLNQVMAKKDILTNLLKAIEKKLKAEADLVKATEKKQKAEEKLLKLAESLSK